MAETYGVLDWHALPLSVAATLAQGLSQSSRTVKRLAKQTVDNREILLAIIADRIGHIAWMLSADGQNGTNHPQSILAALTSTGRQPEGFETAEEFAAAWSAIIGGEADA